MFSVVSLSMDISLCAHAGMENATKIALASTAKEIFMLSSFSEATLTFRNALA
jgi:hypothetical protein